MKFKVGPICRIPYLSIFLFSAYWNRWLFKSRSRAASGNWSALCDKNGRNDQPSWAGHLREGIASIEVQKKIQNNLIIHASAPQLLSTLF